MPHTHLLGGWRATFHTSIASEFHNFPHTLVFLMPKPVTTKHFPFAFPFSFLASVASPVQYVQYGHGWVFLAKISQRQQYQCYLSLQYTEQHMPKTCQYVKIFTRSKISEAKLTAQKLSSIQKTFKLSGGNFVKNVLEKGCLNQDCLY